MPPVIDLLGDLIALPSVNPAAGEPDDIQGEGRVVDYLAARFTAAGLDYELQEVLPGRHNIIARLTGRGGPSLVLESHTDTVRVDGMTIEPFRPEVRQGRIYGRGACDDKASLAAMIVALESVCRRGSPPGDITLAATCDEEYRFRGVKHLVESGFRADGAVVGEPTDLRLITAHKGALRATLTTHGLAAHSSEPARGINAIYAMNRLVTALEAYAEELLTRPGHPLVQGPTACVGMIQGGIAPNIVPDHCSLSLDRRLLPGEDPLTVEPEVRQWLSDRCPGLDWEMELHLLVSGLDTPLQAPITQRVARALHRVCGGCETGGVQYGTDACQFADYGTPAIVLGPGSIHQAHTAEEWVEIEQVEQAVAVYEAIIWDE